MSPAEAAAALGPLTDDQVARVAALLSIVTPSRAEAQDGGGA